MPARFVATLPCGDCCGGVDAELWRMSPATACASHGYIFRPDDDRVAGESSPIGIDDC